MFTPGDHISSKKFEYNLNLLSEIQQENLLHLAYFLHPNKEVAEMVFVETVERYSDEKRDDRKNRTKGEGRDRTKLTPTEMQDAFLQKCLYDVSEWFEKDQESRKPILRLQYRPSLQVKHRRYIKHLVYKAMDKTIPEQAAISVGGYIFDIKLDHLRRLGSNYGKIDLLGKKDYIRQVKSKVAQAITARFPHLADGGQSRTPKIKRRAPEGDEAVWITDARRQFAPWIDQQHVEFVNFQDSFIRCCSIEQIHTLFDAGQDCAGLEKFTEECNRLFGGVLTDGGKRRRFDDPPILLVPAFSSTNRSGNNGDGPDKPPNLKDCLDSIRAKFGRNQERHGRLQRTDLHIKVDHRPVARLTLPDISTASFRVSDINSSVWITGLDDEGELRLASFFLPCLETLDTEEELSLRDDHGRTYLLKLSPSRLRQGGVIGADATIAYFDQAFDGGSTGEASESRDDKETKEPTKKRKELQWKDIYKHANLFDGKTVASLHRCIDEIEAFAVIARHSYDAVWSVLELWEAVGLKGFWDVPELQQAFVRRYVNLCLSTRNPYLKKAMLWGINELFERDGQQELGVEIAKQLLQAPNDIEIRRILYALCQLRPSLRQELLKAGHRPPSSDARTLSLKNIKNKALARLAEWKRARNSSATVNQIPAIPELDDLLSFWDVKQPDEGLAIVAMGFAKQVLKEAVVASQFDDQVIAWFCRKVLRLVDQSPDFPCFLGIESLEGVRDKASAQCAQLMGEYIEEIQKPDLLYGIFTCICEGFEEEETTPGCLGVSGSPGSWVAKERFPLYAKPSREKGHGLESFTIAAVAPLNKRWREVTGGIAYWRARQTYFHQAYQSRRVA